jgi:outer membrane protein OmpA-like peptidoglycan-associated protein
MRVAAALLLTTIGSAAAAQTTLKTVPVEPSATSSAPAPVSALQAAPTLESRVTIALLPRSVVKILPLAAGAVAASDLTTSLKPAAAIARSEIAIAALDRSEVRIEALGGSETLAVEALKSELGARETERGTLVSLPGDILFDFDKHAIRPEARTTLAKLADLVRRTPGGVVLIEGHTDAKGSDSYNVRLSERRAQAVADWLGGQDGIDAARLEERGLGEAQPTAPNTRPDGSDNPEGRQLNRRVEVILTR